MPKRTSLKDRYNIRIRYALMGSLSIVILMFLLVPKKETVSPAQLRVPVEVEIVEIPQTLQRIERATPSRPAIPVPAEDEDIPETFMYTLFEFESYNPTKVPPPPIAETFDSSSVPVIDPEPVGGYEQISDLVQYPSMARYAGLEGSVHIEVVVDRMGTVVATNILEGAPKTGFEEAALAVIQRLQFIPAMRFDEPVPGRDSIRVDFRLR